MVNKTDAKAIRKAGRHLLHGPDARAGVALHGLTSKCLHRCCPSNRLGEFRSLIVTMLAFSVFALLFTIFAFPDAQEPPKSGPTR